MTEQVGIKVKIDHLGRIYIPKRIREQYALEKEAEFVFTEDGLCIRNPQFTLTKRENTV